MRLLRFLAVRGDLKEHHTEAGGGRRWEKSSVCVPEVPVWEKAAASLPISSIFAER